MHIAAAYTDYNSKEVVNLLIHSLTEHNLATECAQHHTTMAAQKKKRSNYKCKIKERNSSHKDIFYSPHAVGQIGIADGHSGGRRASCLRHQQFEVSDRVRQLQRKKEVENQCEKRCQEHHHSPAHASKNVVNTKFNAPLWLQELCPRLCSESRLHFPQF